MRTYAAFLLAALAAVFSSNVDAQAVTYHFTGTVTSSSGIYSGAAVGSQISGTYTINLSNENPLQSNPVSLTTTWAAQTHSGLPYGTTLNSNLVFATAAAGGSFSYTSAAGPYSTLSEVQGVANGVQEIYFGEEIEYLNSTTEVYSQFSLNQIAGTAALWNSNGQPTTYLPTGSTGNSTGAIQQIVAGTTTGSLNYTITSLTGNSVTQPPAPSSDVPLPPWALALLSLGLIGAISRISRRAH